MIISYLQCGTDIEKNETRDISDLKRRFSKECQNYRKCFTGSEERNKKDKVQKRHKNLSKKMNYTSNNSLVNKNEKLIDELSEDELSEDELSEDELSEMSESIDMELKLVIEDDSDEYYKDESSDISELIEKELNELKLKKDKNLKKDKKLKEFKSTLNNKSNYLTKKFNEDESSEIDEVSEKINERLKEFKDEKIKEKEKLKNSTKT
ncbi:hypothetical protein A0H76_2863 [Hepatospora eriocheir]|uniref:Uncharacterized protein n=1 Tax=Hepatospora eriocheir TaxID=1081669 RepID=A0A1X0Q5D3_9MICR|nr:hypothetical protein A0H76_2863 [Hepatospora eriocheir]